MGRKGNPKTMSIFYELHDNSMSFTPFLPKTSPHTTHTVVLGMYLISSKGFDNNVILLPQKCDTLARTTIGRTWMAEVDSQDHTHYTQLLWTPTIKIHIIDSHSLELSKIKSIAFGRSSPSVRVKPSVTPTEAS